MDARQTGQAFRASLNNRWSHVMYCLKVTGYIGEDSAILDESAEVAAFRAYDLGLRDSEIIEVLRPDIDEMH